MSGPAPTEWPEERFPHVARPLGAIHACLSSRTVPHTETALFPILRAAFRSGPASEVSNLIGELDPSKHPRAQRVSRAARLLTPVEADKLDPEDRMRCIPGTGSREVVLLHGNHSEVLEVRISNESTTLWLTLDGPTSLCVTRERAATLRFGVPEEILKKLFDPDVPVPEALWNPGLRASNPTPAGDVYLPARLLEALATVLQNHLRIQVLTHAGMDPKTSRPLAFENLKTFTTKPADVNKTRTFITANLNASCMPENGCLCNVFKKQIASRPGGYGVQISLSFCGFPLKEGSVCPVHHQCDRTTDGAFGNHCMLNPRLSLRCGHPGALSESSAMNLNIPPAALPALLAIAGAACELSQSRDAALDIVDVHDKVDDCVADAEKERLEKRPVCTACTDRDAVDRLHNAKSPEAPYSSIFKQQKRR